MEEYPIKTEDHTPPVDLPPSNCLIEDRIQFTDFHPSSSQCVLIFTRARLSQDNTHDQHMQEECRHDIPPHIGEKLYNGARCIVDASKHRAKSTMPSQSPKPIEIFCASPRTYYNSIREEPDSIHPALRPKEPDRTHPALRPRVLDRQTYAECEAGLTTSALQRSGFHRKLPSFYSGPATKIPDLYPAEYFEDPRPAPRPDSFARVAKQARREHQPPPLAKYWTAKEKGRPTYLDKPLPPLPHEASPFSEVPLKQEPPHWRDSPGRLAVQVDGKTFVRPDSVRVDYDWAAAVDSGKRATGRSWIAETMERESKRLFSFAKRGRRHTVSESARRCYDGT